MEVSHLQVKVTGDGIAETSRKLGGLTKAAENAERKVLKLTDAVATLVGMNGKLATSQKTATAAATAQIGAFNNLHTVLGQIATTMLLIVESANSLNSSLANLNRTSNQTAAGFQRKAHWGGVVTSTLKAMATAAAAYAAVNLAKDVVEQADAWQNMKAKLTIVTGSQHNANVALEDAFKIAQRVRVPLKDVTQLYTRLSPAMQRMGRTGEEVGRVTQSVATALQLSGATAAEASSAMLQLSQSFNSGRLNGGEFNSIAENAPLLLVALAEHMKKPIGALKKLGSEGKITGQDMTDAFIAAGSKWDALFDKMPVTFEGATVRIKNAWAKALGEMGEDTGFNKKLVEGLKIIEGIIPTIAQELAGAFIAVTKWVEQNKDTIEQIWNQVKGLVGDVWEIAGAFGLVARSIIGAGDSVSAVGLAIFSVRLGIAGLQDGFALVGAGVLALGGYILKSLAAPLTDIGGYIIGVIVQRFGDLLELMGKAAKFVGMEGLGDALIGIGTTAQNIGLTVRDLGDGFRTLGNSMQEQAGKTMQYLGSQNNAVQRVLNSEVQLDTFRRKSAGSYDNSKNQTEKHAAAVDEKALKAAAAATKRYEAEADKLNNQLEAQLELAERLSIHGLDYDKLSAGTKERIALEKKLHDQELAGASEFERTRTLGLLLIAKEVELQEKLNERKIEGLKADKAEEDSASAKLKTLDEEAAKLERKARAYAEYKGAAEAMEAAEASAQVALLENLMQRTPHEERMLAIYKAQLEARERIAGASKTIGAYEALKDFDKLLDPKHAERFASILNSAFGKVGQSIGKMADAWSKYQTRQQQVLKLEQAYNTAQKDGKATAQMRAAIENESAQSQISMYGDMATAAKGFFDEKSKEYKAMEVMEKTFRAFELALEIKSYAEKMGMLSSFTAAKVVSDQTQATSAVTGAATEVGAKMAVAEANAVSGVSNQANGDPYSAFPRMAAMAAIMASLGLAVGGSFLGGGGDSGPIGNQGTGTVLGDSNAKSDSIAKAIDALSDVDVMTMRYSAQMAESLRNIESSLGGVTNLLLSSGGVDYKGYIGRETSGFVDIMGKAGRTVVAAWTMGLSEVLGVGHWLEKLNGKLFGTKRTLQGQGLEFDPQTLAQINANGVSATSFANVHVKEGFWSSRDRHDRFSLDQEIKDQFKLIFTNFQDALKAAGEGLGQPLSQIQERLSRFVVNIGLIDLKDLSGEQIQEKLTAVFSALGDNMAKAVLPGFNAFQQVGEGYLETVVRVATGVDSATYELDKLGVSAINFSAIINKQGDVGAEIVRQSLLLQEVGTGVGDILSSLSGSAADIAETYKALNEVRQQMKAVGLGSNLTRDLIRAAGGLDVMSDALKAYQDNFFTDAEKQAAMASQLREQFAKLNLTMPATKDSFRELVDRLQSTGKGSLAMKVLLLADSFAEMSDMIGNSDDAMQAVENARNQLSEVYEREKNALEGVKSKFEDFAKSLHEFHDSLVVGDLSPLSNTEKYATLKAQYDATAAAAMAGDEGAIAKFQSVAEEFLQFSREYNASGAQYTADFQSVLDKTLALEELTAGRATVAEEQLAALNRQVDSLLDINESIMSVDEAVQALTAAMKVAGVVDGSHAGGLSYVPYDGYVAELHKGEAVLTASENKAYQMDYGQYGRKSDESLVNEIKALRQEVSTLREQQAEQTAALIASNYDANERNAQTVVAGTHEAVSVNNYSEKAKVTIA